MNNESMRSPQRRPILFVGGANLGVGSPHPIMSAIWLRYRGYSIRCVLGHGHESGVFRTPLGDLDLEASFSAAKHVSAIGRQAFLVKALLRHRLFQDHRSGQGSLYYIHGSSVTPASLFALKGVAANRIIYHTQDFLEPGRHPQWEFFERRFARRAGLVVCNEPNRARFLASHYRLATMPLVVRTALPRDWPGPDRAAEARQDLCRRAGLEGAEEAVFIAAGGPYSEVRQSANMIRALRHLGPMCYLVFSGSGPESCSRRKIMELAKECGILRQVVYLEQLPYSELLNYYGACDVGLLLYANDGIGNYCQCPGRFSAYLLCGLPMVLSKFPSLEMLTLKHVVGTTCDGNDPESIAKAVRSLVDLPRGARKEMRLRIARCGKSEWVYDDDASILERRIDELP